MLKYYNYQNNILFAVIDLRLFCSHLWTLNLSTCYGQIIKVPKLNKHSFQGTSKQSECTYKGKIWFIFTSSFLFYVFKNVSAVKRWHLNQ